MQAVEKGLLAWSALVATPGLGPKRLVELAISLDRMGKKAAEILGASAQELERIGLSHALAERASRLLSDPPFPAPAPDEAVLLTPDDPSFPLERLDPEWPLPVLLYAAGNISLLRRPAIAISGSRAAPDRALELADRIAATLAKQGLNVVSGHASGIDETAHSSALKAGGTTTAVLAEGLLGFLPRQALREAEGESLLLVSGFKPEARWTVYHAMGRNKWIAALADAVIVVAANIRGGSWSQGILCLKAGKTLFVPNFSENLAPGNRRLIERGALPLDPDDPESMLERSNLAAGVRLVSDQGDLFG